MIKALEAGSVPHGLQIMAIGPKNHSRWLTTANRFRDLWTRDHDLVRQDLINLRHICMFIIGVYYKQWFNIKREHKLVDRARHMLKQVQLIKNYCSNEVRAIVDRCVSRNSYFANSELIILTLLASDNEEERRFGLNIIREKIRKGSSQGNFLPYKCYLPKINF